MSSPYSKKKYCKIVGCQFFNGVNTAEQNVVMFRMPNSGELRDRWIDSIKTHQQFSSNDEHTLYYSVCSNHFEKSQVFGSVNRRLKPGAYPTIFPENVCVEMNLELNVETNNVISDFEQVTDQVNITDESISVNENLKKRLDSEIEIMRLKEQLKKATEKATKLDLALKIFKEESCSTQQDNAKLRKELNHYESQEQNLSDDAKQIMKCFRGKRNETEDNRSYSPAIRKFALTMYCHSPRSYKYVRDKFNKNLPHPTTLRKWYANSDIKCEPGILPEAMKTLKSLNEQLKATGKRLLVSLSFDEIAIKQHMQWIHDQKKFSGCVFQDGEMKFAKDVLVFMVTVLNPTDKGSCSIPVAYYCINKLNANEKSIILIEVLTALNQIGTKVVNIVFDGLPTNLSMCDLLGASFNVDEPKPYIDDPVDGSKIYILLDICHMLKLIRSTLGDYRTIAHPGHGKIEWIYFERLVLHQQKNRYVTHKLNKHHILYFKNRMNVRLAAQTFSNSVACSMDYLRNMKVRGFQNCLITSIFTRKMNTAFDIFNAKKVDEKNPLKSAIYENNARIVFDFFRKTIKYLKTLRLQGVLCVNSRRYTGFVGFIIGMLSAEQMYNDYVVTGELDHLALFFHSQDVLESFFGRVRAICGSNDNPTVQQFKGSMRKLLFFNEVSSSVFANCIDNLNILNVSSDIKQPGTDDACRDMSNEEEEEIEQSDQNFEQIEELNTQTMPKYSKEDATIAFIAGKIEKKVSSSRFACTECAEICEKIFEENEKIDGPFVNNPETQRPCHSTLIIAKCAYEAFNENMENSNFNYTKVHEMISERIKFENFYPLTDFVHNSEHKNYLIGFIVDEYVRVYATYVAKCLTMEHQQLLTRTRNRKITHFKGQ